jgi:glycolate oxidase
LAGAVLAIEEISRRLGVPVCTLAHAGDGILHPIIVAGDPIPAAARQAADEIFALALRLGGTPGCGDLRRSGRPRSPHDGGSDGVW